MEACPLPNAQFVYHDLPHWARFWKRGPRGVQLYYRLWQKTVAPVVRRLHEEVGFDLVHHITFAKSWAPSYLARLPIPLLWGPLGGGDSTPQPFRRDLSFKGRVYEAARDGLMRLATLDPAIRATAKGADIALATTEGTVRQLRELGCRDVRPLPQAALASDDVQGLRQTVGDFEAPGLRFLCMGSLLHLKGYHLALEAFAKAALDGSELWVLGDGPEAQALVTRASHLGVAERVRFFGQLPREEALAKLAECHVLVHPSFHDSCPWACVEAMMAGRPVLSLDLSGPRSIVDDSSGIRVPATFPRETISALAHAMRRLSEDRTLLRRLGAGASVRACDVYTWDRRERDYDALYREVARMAR